MQYKMPIIVLLALIGIGISTWLYYSYTEYHPDKIRVKMINKLQDCEEYNMNFTIVQVESDKYGYLKNVIVMPIFDEPINTKENNELFFSFPALRRLEITVEGYYSRRPNSNDSDGCIGAHLFKIVRIVTVEDVKNKYNYPIDYKSKVNAQ